VIEVTGTFKPKKQDLLREGYDPALSTDIIYFDDRASQAFVKIDTGLYDRINTRQVRI
jgi:fatty-acyl-CoA synthase